MDTAIIKKVQDAGFDVYMRRIQDAWLIFTDGTRLGSLQNGWRGLALSTVHKPNHTTGTGYGLDGFLTVDSLTRGKLESAFEFAPAWASPRYTKSVHKFADISAFINADSWNREYALVPKQ